MNRALSVMLGLCVAASAFAQDANESGKKQDKKPESVAKPDDSKVLAILKKVDAATKKVKTVSYNVTVKGTGTLEARTPKLTGKVILAGRAAEGLDKYFIEFKGETPNGSRVEGTMGSDADEFFLLDPKTKTAHVDIDGSVLGAAGRWLRLLGMIEFVHPTPFSDEINGDRREMKGDKKIGGEECYVINVVYSGGQGEATWYFSKKDFLPRRVDRWQRGATTERAATVVILTELKADPKIDTSIFKAKIPDGWTKTDEPAP